MSSETRWFVKDEDGRNLPKHPAKGFASYEEAHAFAMDFAGIWFRIETG